MPARASVRELATRGVARTGNQSDRASAIRSLKQQCAASAGSTAATQAAGQKPAAPLGIMAGYYVLESEACSNPEFEAISQHWGSALRDAFAELPDIVDFVR